MSWIHLAELKRASQVIAPGAEGSVQVVGDLKRAENLVLIRNDLLREMNSNNWKKGLVPTSAEWSG
jgi:hypothetical protein